MRSENIPSNPVDALSWIFRHTKTVPAPEGYGLENPCRLYLRHDGRPYGSYRLLQYDGERTAVHRLVFRFVHGAELPSGKVVLHRCDRPNCVEPTHLELGTLSQNSRDAFSRKRKPTRKGLGKAKGEWRIHQDPHAAALARQLLEQEPADVCARPGGKSQIHERSLTTRDILTILLRGHSTDPLQLAAECKRLAVHYKRTPTSIRHIWKGRVFRDVHPEISRLRMSGAPRAKLTDEAVGRLRATWQAHPLMQVGKTGFLKALAKFAGMSVPATKAVLLERFRPLAGGQNFAPIELSVLGYMPFPVPSDRPPRGRLTVYHVMAIFEQYNRGESAPSIAARLGKSITVISDILRGRTWRPHSCGLRQREATRGPKPKNSNLHP